MSIIKIIQHMEKLKQLHESLLQLSKEKTEQLKEGDTEGLQKLLAKERKHIQAISKMESERLQAVEDWYSQQDLEVKEPTISNLLELLNDSKEREDLQKLQADFVFLIADLKKQEQLNAELTKQSLQFIHLSLDMIQPDFGNMNYNKPAETPAGAKRSLFDSKA